MKASPRHRRAGASALALFGFFALLAAFLPGVANAQQGGGNPDVCWNVEGFERDLKASISEEWGSATWTPTGGSDGIVTINVNEGYEVEVCLKKGPRTYVVGPFGADVGADFQVNPPAEAPGDPGDGVSHYDVRVVTTPTEEPEPETFEVSPAKVWVEPAPAGATATIALEVEDEGDWVPVADAVWTFDNEGGQTAGPESWTLDEGTVYRFVETEIGSPEGFECFEVEVDDAAADTLYNDCAGVEGEEEENGGENGNGGDNGDNGGESGGVLEDGEENGGEVGGIGEEAPTTTEGETAVAGATLPRTGVGSGLLAGLGIASLLAGLGLTRAGRRELV